MEAAAAFLARKDVQISAKRYGIDALSAMAQGLFASLVNGHHSGYIRDFVEC